MFRTEFSVALRLAFSTAGLVVCWDIESEARPFGAEDCCRISPTKRTQVCVGQKPLISVVTLRTGESKIPPINGPGVFDGGRTARVGYRPRSPARVHPLQRQLLRPPQRGSNHAVAGGRFADTSSKDLMASRLFT
jgi:hypothetical protein